MTSPLFGSNLSPSPSPRTIFVSESHGDVPHNRVNSGKAVSVGRQLYLRVHFTGDSDTPRGGGACLISETEFDLWLSHS